MTKLDISESDGGEGVSGNGGEPVQVETNNEYITTWVDSGGTLNGGKSHGFFGWGGTAIRN